MITFASLILLNAVAATPPMTNTNSAIKLSKAELIEIVEQTQVQNVKLNGFTLELPNFEVNSNIRLSQNKIAKNTKHNVELLAKSNQVKTSE